MTTILERFKDLLNLKESKKELTESELIGRVKQDPSYIKEIKNPSENIQFLAVDESPIVLKYIAEPLDKVVVYAISQDPTVIEKLDKRPSDQVLIKAIQENPRVFYHIDNSSPEVELAAVRREGSLIGHINNPSSKLIEEAIYCSPKAIKYIVNPTEAAQIQAVTSEKETIKLIQNPVDNLLEKSGWIIYKNDQNMNNSPDLNKIPTSIQVLELNQASFRDTPDYTEVSIQLTNEAKAELIKKGSIDLGFDDSPRSDISGGHAILVLEKNGEMYLDKQTTAIEGGSVNYYDTKTPINIADCDFNELGVKLQKEPAEKLKGLETNIDQGADLGR